VKVDVQASEGHFLHHLAGVWNALDESERGTLYVAKAAQRAARQLGLEHVVSRQIPPHSTAVRLLASWGDLKNLRLRLPPGEKVVFMEHGVGYTFGTGHESYAGGKGKERVDVFLNPNEQTSRNNAAAYPDAIQETVGCPKLDSMPLRSPSGRVVCVSFHWPAAVAPETNWAFPEFRNALRDLGKRTGCEVIGHGHPRALERLRPIYERMGIECVDSFDEVMRRCDLYVNDSSSTIYEAAALGRPVVVLNSRHYRRDVDFGLRFWDHIPGPQVAEAADLAGVVAGMLDGGWRDWEQTRLAAVRAAYGPWGNDGNAAKRAVEAIRAHCG
jgi:hypothetical protein